MQFGRSRLDDLAYILDQSRDTDLQMQAFKNNLDLLYKALEVKNLRDDCIEGYIILLSDADKGITLRINTLESFARLEDADPVDSEFDIDEGLSYEINRYICDQGVF